MHGLLKMFPNNRCKKGEEEGNDRNPQRVYRWNSAWYVNTIIFIICILLKGKYAFQQNYVYFFLEIIASKQRGFIKIYKYKQQMTICYLLCIPYSL